MAVKESEFQESVAKELESRIPGVIVLKNDPNYIQGIPDLTIIYKDKWATLECKKSKTDSHQPNQDYYVSLMNEWSYSSFIYPENKEVILDEVQSALRA